MSCRTEFAGALSYRFCPDPPPVLADRVRAVLRARLVDEITEDPIAVDAGLRTSVQGLHVHRVTGGNVGLIGQPARLFPDLGSSAVDLDLSIEASGYLPLTLTRSLGPVIGFPAVFAALDVGDIALHRQAVALRGRCVQRASLAPVVVSGATVRIDGVWFTFPPANVSPALLMQPANLVHLAPGFYAERSAGAVSVRQRDLLPVAGQDKRLLLPAVIGTSRVRLSDRIGLAVGTPLRIDAADAGRVEDVVIDHIDLTFSDDQPAWLTLAYPLAHTHIDGALCMATTPQPAGAVNGLIRDAISGDECAFLDGLLGIASGATVEVSDGVTPPEYHQAQRYETLSDADGYFRLPPVARVAMVLLHAERLGLTAPDDSSFAPDYRLADNRITVTFP